MLLAIIDSPRAGSQSSRVRKILQLRCDECHVEFERRWQREVSEQLTHCCSRKCARSLQSKNVEWRNKVSLSVIARMAHPDVRKRYEEGLEKRNQNPDFRIKLSQAAKRKFQENPQLGRQHSLKLKQKFKDPVFKEWFKSRLTKRVNVWWKPWMENIKDDIHWSNRVIHLCRSICVKCGSKECLHAHHIALKSCHPELRHDLNNGIALCKSCHVGPNGVHRLLREDQNRYETLMKELIVRRDMLLNDASEQSSSHVEETDIQLVLETG